MLLMVCFGFTDHCCVQERGDVEDFVQTHGRVDAFVLFAIAKKDTNKQIHTRIREERRERERKC